MQATYQKSLLTDVSINSFPGVKLFSKLKGKLQNIYSLQNYLAINWLLKWNELDEDKQGITRPPRSCHLARNFKLQGNQNRLGFPGGDLF